MMSPGSAFDWRLLGDWLGGPNEPPGGPPQPPPSRRDNGNNNEDGEGRSGALTLTRTRTKKPSMYKVLMLNDDYTPMEFVVDVLQRIFQKNRDEATQIMLHVHQKGVGVCGVYTYEVAETKVTQTVDYARKNQHPLQCTLEKE
jgi:ATP-dependent Clp protease adaptor protein ClpS